MSDASDLLAARYRLTRILLNATEAMMNDMERERDIDLLPHRMAVLAAWGAVQDVDSAWQAARAQEE